MTRTRAEGRLWISISSLFPVPHNHMQSAFASREDLIDAVIAAQYIPTWTHPGVCTQAHARVDGGVTNNLPALSPASLKVGLDADDVASWGADLVPSEPLSRVNVHPRGRAEPAEDAALREGRRAPLAENGAREGVRATSGGERVKVVGANGRGVERSVARGASTYDTSRSTHSSM